MDRVKSLQRSRDRCPDNVGCAWLPQSHQDQLLSGIFFDTANPSKTSAALSAESSNAPGEPDMTSAMIGRAIASDATFGSSSRVAVAFAQSDAAASTRPGETSSMNRSWAWALWTPVRSASDRPSARCSYVVWRSLPMSLEPRAHAWFRRLRKPGPPRYRRRRGSPAAHQSIRSSPCSCRQSSVRAVKRRSRPVCPQNDQASAPIYTGGRAHRGRTRRSSHRPFERSPRGRARAGGGTAVRGSDSRARAPRSAPPCPQQSTSGPPNAASRAMARSLSVDRRRLKLRPPASGLVHMIASASDVKIALRVAFGKA